MAATEILSLGIYSTDQPCGDYAVPQGAGIVGVRVTCRMSDEQCLDPTNSFTIGLEGLSAATNAAWVQIGNNTDAVGSASIHGGPPLRPQMELHWDAADGPSRVRIRVGSKGKSILYSVALEFVTN